MKKATNKNAYILVDKGIPFIGSNTMGVYEGKLYVVYSYGKHFPMYVYNPDGCKWLANGDKYSVSTSKQQSQLRPTGTLEYHTTEELLKYIKDNMQ